MVPGGVEVADVGCDCVRHGCYDTLGGGLLGGGEHGKGGCSGCRPGPGRTPGRPGGGPGGCRRRSACPRTRRRTGCGCPATAAGRRSTGFRPWRRGESAPGSRISPAGGRSGRPRSGWRGFLPRRAFPPGRESGGPVPAPQGSHRRHRSCGQAPREWAPRR